MMATRPGPLRDIPLDHERLKLHSDGHIPSQFKSPGKRPLSPSSYATCSPSKRRLVEQQTRSNAASGSRHSSTPHQSHVRALLQGPNSPARKLDFGAAPNDTQAGDQPTHHTRSVTRRLADATVPSSLLPSFDSSSTSSEARPSSLLSVLESSPMDVEMNDHDFDPQTPPSIASRGTLPQDHATNYRGFAAYRNSQDPSSSHLPPSSPPSSSMALDAVDSVDDADADKENIRPARPAKLCFGEGAWAKAGLLCPREVQTLCSPARTPSSLSRNNQLASLEDEECGEAEEDQAMNISPRAPRRIRDIANINMQPIDLHGKMTLTSNSFSLLCGEKEKTQERARNKADDVEDGRMDVENMFEGEKSEIERRG